jgi:hypothetical protein
LPDWAVKLLDIHLRGYLPCNDAWKGFHVIGDTIHYYSYNGPREVSARQLMALDYALPQTSDMKNELFWDKYYKRHTTKRAH